MKIKSIIILSLLLTFIISSCKNDIVEQTLKVNRAEIKRMASLHHKGLEYLKENRIKTKGGGIQVPLDPIRTPLEISNELTPALFNYLELEGLQDYKYLANSIPGFNLDNLPTVSLSQTGQAYSQQFYLTSNQLLAIQEPSSYQDLNNQIEAIITSTNFLNLSTDEQTILTSAAEVMLDSYSYWSTPINIPILVATKGFWGGFWRTVKRDLKGALSGAITAGIASRNGTAMVAGAIAGAILHSAFAAELSENEQPLFKDDRMVLIGNVLVPAELDEIIYKPQIPVLNFPTNYIGAYYYVSHEGYAHNDNTMYSTFIYSNNNKNYYNVGLTCLLPDGIYFNTSNPKYYKVKNGIVIEIGNKPIFSSGEVKPIQHVIDNLFPACN